MRVRDAVPVDHALRTVEAVRDPPERSPGGLLTVREHALERCEHEVEPVPLARLEHYPRYVRAAQARLQRAIADPRKDADKHAPFGPLWEAYLAKRSSEGARELRWSFEELRVAIFAPELKTAEPVSIAKVAAAVAALR